MESIKSSLVVTSRHSKAIAVISRSLLTKVQYLVKNVSTECQWFHSITKTTYADGIVFRLDELIIPPQEVTGATVDSSPADVMAMSNEIKLVAGGYNPEYNEMLKRIKCWSHSHVNMAPSPSGTDEQTFKEYVTDTVAQNADGKQYPVGMFILNKQNKYYLRIYDPELDLIFDGLTLHIEDQDVDLTYVDEAIKNKITTKKQNFAAVYNNKDYSEQFIYGTESVHKKKSETDTKVEDKRDQKLQIFDAIFQKIYDNILVHTDDKVKNYIVKQELNRLNWSTGEYNLAKDILKAIDYYGPARESYLNGVASKVMRNAKEYDPASDYDSAGLSENDDQKSFTMISIQQLATFLVESKRKLTMSHFQRLVTFLQEDMYLVADQSVLTQLLIRIIAGEK